MGAPSGFRRTAEVDETRNPRGRSRVVAVVTFDFALVIALVATTAVAVLRHDAPAEPPTIHVAPELETLPIVARHEQHERSRKEEMAHRLCTCACCCDWCEAMKP